MALNYELSEEARADLISIWNYTLTSWSEKQADRYYSKLISAFDYIAAKPYFAGHLYDDIISGLRGYRVGKHIIFYISQNNKTLIVRILHEKMDISRFRF